MKEKPYSQLSQDELYGIGQYAGQAPPRTVGPLRYDWDWAPAQDTPWWDNHTPTPRAYPPVKIALPGINTLRRLAQEHDHYRPWFEFALAVRAAQNGHPSYPGEPTWCQITHKGP